MPALPLLGRRLHHEVIALAYRPPTRWRPAAAYYSDAPIVTTSACATDSHWATAARSGDTFVHVCRSYHYAPAAARPTAIALRVVVLSNAIRLPATIG